MNGDIKRENKDRKAEEDKELVRKNRTKKGIVHGKKRQILNNGKQLISTKDKQTEAYKQKSQGVNKENHQN